MRLVPNNELVTRPFVPFWLGGLLFNAFGRTHKLPTLLRSTSSSIDLRRRVHGVILFHKKQQILSYV